MRHNCCVLRIFCWLTLQRCHYLHCIHQYGHGYSRHSPYFVELEGSLPHSQQPTTCLYPEPDQCSLCCPFHFLKMHFNIILPSMPGYSRWLHSLRFPHQKPERTSPLPNTSYLPRPFHSSSSDHPNNIRCGVRSIKLLVM